MARLGLQRFRFMHALRIGGASMMAIAIASGCVSTSVKPINDPNFQPLEDEQKLWSRADQFDKEVLEQDALYRDEEIEAYLSDVARKLLPHFGATDVAHRVFIVPDPFLNAFAMANGSVYLHSGLIARAENESQLALVLAHELSHYTRRHSLREHRTARNNRTAGVVGAVALSVLVGVRVEPGSLPDYLESIRTSHYARDLEREADLDAFTVISQAGYELDESIKIFEQMMEEAEEIDQPYEYGSHPTLAERLADGRRYVPDVAQQSAYSVATNELAANEFYDDQISELLLMSAEMSFERGLARKARRNVERYIQVRPDNIEGQLLLGRIHKSRMSEDEHRDSAIAAYRDVIRIDPDNATGHRELGLMLRGKDERSESDLALRRYLELAPEALDRPIIESYLQLGTAIGDGLP